MSSVAWLPTAVYQIPGPGSYQLLRGMYIILLTTCCDLASAWYAAPDSQYQGPSTWDPLPTTYRSLPSVGSTFACLVQNYYPLHVDYEVPLTGTHG